MPDLSLVAGVSAVEIDTHRLRCHVTGSIGPLLEALARSHVTRLISREPSLEELFLSHYGMTGDREPADVA